MRWIYVMIIPALLLLPTFGQAAGESSTENLCPLATKATPAKIATFSFSTKIEKEQPQATKKTTTKKETSVKDKEVSNQPTQKQKNTALSPATSQPSSTSTKQATTSADTSVLPIEQEVVRLVNVERAKQGLQPLVLDEKLSSIARTKSQDMKDNGYFSHQSPTYGSPFDMLKKFGVSYRTAGENIAAGYSSAQAVVTGWMNSEGHRANILNKSFTKIGVGYVSGGSYGSYWTQLFTG